MTKIEGGNPILLEDLVKLYKFFEYLEEESRKPENIIKGAANTDNNSARKITGNPSGKPRGTQKILQEIVQAVKDAVKKEGTPELKEYLKNVGQQRNQVVS